MSTPLVDLVHTHVQHYNMRDYDALIRDYAPDADILTSWSQERPTPQEHAAWFRDSLVAGFPEIQIEVEEVMTAGDEVVAFKWHWRAPHTGVLDGVPPMGETVSHQGITMLHVEDGKIEKERIVAASTPGPWDRLDAPDVPATTPYEPTDPNELERIVREFLRHFEARDADALLAMYAPDAALPSKPGAPFITREERVDGFRYPNFTAFPNPSQRLEQIVTAGDIVAFKWRFRVRHEGHYYDVAPTGEEISNTAISIFKVRDKKIVTERLFMPYVPGPWDRVGVTSESS